MTFIPAGIAPAPLRRIVRREVVRLGLGFRGLTQPCRVTLAVLATTAAASLLFIAAPGIDLAVSAAFHEPGRGFTASSVDGLRLLRRSSTWVMGIILAVALATAFAPRGWPGAVAGRRRHAVCLLAAFALGPGLLVNGLLKGLWGRARPVNVDLFGGDDPFVAAWMVSDGCSSNCSFTSGEAASSAWMALAAVILAPMRFRPAIGAAVIAYALALSMNRVAFGGHFISDVTLSWLLTTLSVILVFRILPTAPASALAPRLATAAA